MRKRRSTRLRDYDYRQDGVYFVTICTHQLICLFGDVIDGAMRLNANGVIVEEEWRRTAELRPYVGLDVFVVMPNHVHGILMIEAGERFVSNPGKHLPARSLGAIVGQFKGSVSKRIRARQGMRRIKVWQRNYHDRVVRSEKALQAIRGYIVYNPARWAEDEYFDY